MWLIILAVLYPCSVNIPLKECLAYGEVKGPQQVRGGGGEEEEAHIYDVADQQLPRREDDGDYEPTDLQLPGATREGKWMVSMRTN